MTGAEIVVKSLIAQGVDTVFGYPGGNILPVYDVLSKTPEIRHILSCHEQFSCHAADGYARASGKVGVVLATSGPGATNLVTGIANAYMDSVPLVAITGNVSLPLLGHDAFQEIDIAGVTMPITKHNYIVKSVDDLTYIMKNAFRIAESGRKGPVLVDIPTDIFDMESNNTDVTPLDKKVFPISEKECFEAVDAINKSENPFICSGGGVISSCASDKVYKLAKLLGCPVSVTAMGKGSYPADDGLYTGVVGMNISNDTVNALANCDLFIAIGVRFSEKLMANVIKFAPNAKILHFDIDKAEIGKNTDYFIRVVGDVSETLGVILPEIKRKNNTYTTEKALKSDGVMEIIGKYSRDVIITTEVGLHQVEAVSKIPTIYPRTFITSGGLGTMGFGLPSAIGATLATGKTVINIAGDGSFNMNFSEITTAVKYNLPIISVIFVNGTLGMIEKFQNERFGGRLYMTKVPEIDYSELSEALGATSYTPENTAEFESCLEKAVKEKRPAVVVLKT